MPLFLDAVLGTGFTVRFPMSSGMCENCVIFKWQFRLMLYSLRSLLSRLAAGDISVIPAGSVWV